jgi:hypothetical protein
MNSPKRLQNTLLPPGQAESSWEYIRRNTFLKGRKQDEDQAFRFVRECNAYVAGWRHLKEVTPPGYGANPTEVRC